MTLKRVTKQEDARTSGSAGGGSGSAGGAAAIKNTAFIARQAGGLCFDFNPKDTNTYVFTDVQVSGGNTPLLICLRDHPAIL